MKSNSWTQTEDNFLSDNYLTMSDREISKHLPGRTDKAVKTRRKKLNLIGKKFAWTPEALNVLRTLYPTVTSQKIADKIGCSLYTVYGKAYELGLKKSEEFLQSEDSGRLTKNKVVGFNTRFKKGFTPWNKDTKGLTASNKTSFKKNHRPHNTTTVGDIRKTTDGYLKIKIGEPNVWKFFHHYVWENHHKKPIPRGLVLRFKDNNQENCAIENLELISKKEHCLKNSIQNYPEDLKKAIFTLTSLKRKINRRKEQNAEK